MTPAKLVLQTGQGHLVKALAFVLGGKLLATGHEDNLIRLWDARTGQLRRTLAGHNKQVTSLAASPDGKLLASGGEDCAVCLWNPQTGKLKQISKGHPEWNSSWILSVALSPIEPLVAVGLGWQNWNDSGTVALCDVETGKVIRSMEGSHGDGFTYAVAFSPDGKWLASASGNAGVRLWTVRTGKRKNALSAHRPIAFSPDGSTLITGSEAYWFRIWDFRSGTRIRTLKRHDGLVSAVAIAPDGTTIATGTSVGCPMWRCDSDVWATVKSAAAKFPGYEMLGELGRGTPLISDLRRSDDEGPASRSGDPDDDRDHHPDQEQPKHCP